MVLGSTTLRGSGISPGRSMTRSFRWQSVLAVIFSIALIGAGFWQTWSSGGAQGIGFYAGLLGAVLGWVFYLRARQKRAVFAALREPAPEPLIEVTDRMLAKAMNATV